MGLILNFGQLKFEEHSMSRFGVLWRTVLSQKLSTEAKIEY